MELVEHTRHARPAYAEYDSKKVMRQRKNVEIDYRWADGQYDRLPEMAARLVGRQVSLIFAGGPAAHVAKAATTTIPIVFVSGEDPVQFGLVASLNRPGGNVTGVTTFNAVVGSKRIELLHELVSSSALMALLVNPKYPSAESETRETQAAARALGHPRHFERQH